MIFNQHHVVVFSSFIQYNSTILFSPYIKIDALKAINESKNIKKIVVAWSIEDLVKGVSDLELYDYCKDNGIVLYRNVRIHLKALWDGKDNVIAGSGNITKNGLALHNGHNYELAGVYKQVNLDTQVYLQRIINDSQVMNDSLYSDIKQLVEEQKQDYIPIKELPEKQEVLDTSKDFLVSALPQSLSPELFLETCLNWELASLLDQQCALSDLLTYQIELSGKNKLQIKGELEQKFNTHPFIIKFKDFIINQDRQSSNYGKCLRWIQDNCTNVPIPRSYEMKEDGVVNILYRWICYFDPKFSVVVPRHSEVLQYTE